MRAVTYDSYATDNARLSVGEVDDPKVGPGQVLVEVRAAGVNPVDWKVMAGGLDAMMSAWFPVVPGWDVAGIVQATGPDTPEFTAGDAVMAYARKDVVRDGTFAQYVSVDAGAVARKPAALDWAQAGGLPLAGMTAQRTLDRLSVHPGDIVLVHGASGGVGHLGVQLAAWRGARVIGTCSPRNDERVRALGAEPVAYGPGLADRVMAMAPDGVTAVADFTGGNLETTLAVLAPGGRHASVADPTVQQHGGQWIWVRPDGARLDELAAAATDGALTVQVERTFGLDAVGEAFDASRSGHAAGKLVVIP